MESSVKIGRVAGIEIGLHYSWLIIAGLTAWSLSTLYFPFRHPHVPPSTSWLLGSVSALLLFAAVLIHELSHALVAQARGLRVRSITLFIFGGVANMGGEPQRPQSELLIAIAGPAASLALAAISFAVALFFGDNSWRVEVIAEYMGMVNFTLAMFNMLPGFPLDGGRVLRSLLWQITGDVRWATKVAAMVGTLVAYLFIAFGVWQAVTGNLLNGIWAAAIGWFLSNAAAASMPPGARRHGPVGVRVADVMQSDPLYVAEDATLDNLIEQHLLHHNLTGLPVVRDNCLVGMVTLRDITKAPRTQWSTTAVGTVMTPQEQMQAIGPWDDLSLAIRLLATDELDRVPVIEKGLLVGVLSRGDIVRHIGAYGDLGPVRPRRWWRWPFGRR